MGFTNGAKAKVWEIRDIKGNYSIKVTISRKLQNGEYMTTFCNYVWFCGSAKDKVAQIKVGDIVQLDVVDVTTVLKNKKVYTNFNCYECSLIEEVNEKIKQAKEDNKFDENILPF